MPAIPYNSHPLFRRIGRNAAVAQENVKTVKYPAPASESIPTARHETIVLIRSVRSDNQPFYIQLALQIAGILRESAHDRGVYRFRVGSVGSGNLPIAVGMAGVEYEIYSVDIEVIVAVPVALLNEVVSIVKTSALSGAAEEAEDRIEKEVANTGSVALGQGQTSGLAELFRAKFPAAVVKAPALSTRSSGSLR